MIWNRVNGTSMKEGFEQVKDTTSRLKTFLIAAICVKLNIPSIRLMSTYNKNRDVLHVERQNCNVGNLLLKGVGREVSF